MIFKWGTSHPGWRQKRVNSKPPFKQQNLGKNTKNRKIQVFSEFSLNFEVDGLKQSYFKVDGLVLRSMNSFISWRSASHRKNNKLVRHGGPKPEDNSISIYHDFVYFFIRRIHFLLTASRPTGSPNISYYFLTFPINSY